MTTLPTAAYSPEANGALDCEAPASRPWAVAFANVVWITFLIVSFVVIGLRRAIPSRTQYILVLLTSAITTLVVYLTWGTGSA